GNISSGVLLLVCVRKDDVREVMGCFENAQELVGVRKTSPPNFHIETRSSPLVNKRGKTDQSDIFRHYALKIGEDAGPGKAFAQEKVVKELYLIQLCLSIAAAHLLVQRLEFTVQQVSLFSSRFLCRTAIRCQRRVLLIAEELSGRNDDENRQKDEKTEIY